MTSSTQTLYWERNLGLKLVILAGVESNWKYSYKKKKSEKANQLLLLLENSHQLQMKSFLTWTSLCQVHILWVAWKPVKVFGSRNTSEVMASVLPASFSYSFGKFWSVPGPAVETWYFRTSMGGRAGRWPDVSLHALHFPSLQL